MSDKELLPVQKLEEVLTIGAAGYSQYLEKLSPRKLKAIRQQLHQFKYGVHIQGPITCHGPQECPFIHQCPIPERTEDGIEYGPDEDYPIFNPCVLEYGFMVEKLREYVQHLHIDAENPVELQIANKLALLDLLERRALMVLSHGDRDGQGRDLLRQDKSVYVKDTNQGSETSTSTVTQLHPVLTAIDGFDRRREKLHDSLVQTRRGQAEIAAKLGQAQKESALAGDLRRFREYLEGQKVDSDPILLEE